MRRVIIRSIAGPIGPPGPPGLPGAPGESSRGIAHVSGRDGIDVSNVNGMTLVRGVRGFSPYIVDPHGSTEYSSLQSAWNKINQDNPAHPVIFLLPGTHHLPAELKGNVFRCWIISTHQVASEGATGTEVIGHMITNKTITWVGLTFRHGSITTQAYQYWTGCQFADTFSIQVQNAEIERCIFTSSHLNSPLITINSGQVDILNSLFDIQVDNYPVILVKGESKIDIKDNRIKVISTSFIDLSTLSSVSIVGSNIEYQGGGCLITSSEMEQVPLRISGFVNIARCSLTIIDGSIVRDYPIKVSIFGSTVNLTQGQIVNHQTSIDGERIYRIVNSYIDGELDRPLINLRGRRAIIRMMNISIDIHDPDSDLLQGRSELDSLIVSTSEENRIEIVNSHLRGPTIPWISGEGVVSSSFSSMDGLLPGTIAIQSFQEVK